MNKIFISYRREDSATVTGRIYDWLTQRLPKDDVFFDVDLEYGVNFVDRIRQTIAQCKTVVVVIGPRWLDADGALSPYVRMEVELALSEGVRVIPVLVGNATMPPANKLPPSLQRLSLLNAASVRDGRDFRHDMQDLEQALGIPAGKGGQVSPDKPRPQLLHGSGARVVLASGIVLVAVVIGVFATQGGNLLQGSFGLGGQSGTGTTDAAAASLYAQVTHQPVTLNDSLAAPGPSAWTTGQSAYFGTCSFDGGAYHAMIATADRTAECTANGAEYGNVALQVDMKIVSGDAGGIIVRYDALHGMRVRFIVYQDSHYDVTVGSGAYGSAQLAAGESQYIHSGQGADNALTIIVQSGTAYLYANGHFLQTVSLSGAGVPTYGRLGVVAYDYSLATDVAFTNERVWTL